MNKEQVIAFWQGEKAARLSYPMHRGRWPDEDTPAILRQLCIGYVCEIGCGTGRCSDAFTPECYVGLDINEAAVIIAAKENPKHVFYTIKWDDEYPAADTYLFYTTLQHVPDDALLEVFIRCSNRIVIQEIMLRECRNEHLLRFHRSPDDYRDALEAAGFEIIDFREYPTTYQPQRKDRPKFSRRFLVAEER